MSLYLGKLGELIESTAHNTVLFLVSVLSVTSVSSSSA